MDISKLNDDLQFCIQRQSDALREVGLFVSKGDLNNASWWANSADDWQLLIDDLKETIDAEMRESEDDLAN